MKEEKVSIIIPVYNVEKYLKECVLSVENQNYKNIEIILINDGSSDNSSNLCDELADTYKNIKVFHVSNGGVSRARNLGIKAATGKYIAFIDSDDFINENMLFSLVSKLEEKNADLAVCNYSYFYKNKNIPSDFTSKEVLSIEEAKVGMFKNNSIRGFTCNKIFHSKIIKENNIFFNEDIKICEDLLFCFQYLSFCKRVVTMSVPLYNYRMRKSSASNKNVEKDLTLFHAFKEMEKIDSDVYRYSQELYPYLYFKYYHELKKHNKLNKVKKINFFKFILNKKIIIKTKIYIIAYLILPKKLQFKIKNKKKSNLQYYE